MRLASSKSPVRYAFSGLAALTAGALLTIGFSGVAAQAATPAVTKAALSLTVHDDSGVAVDDASVTLYAKNVGTGTGGYSFDDQESTGSTGTASFSDLVPGASYQAFVDVINADGAPIADASGWVTGSTLSATTTTADWTDASGIQLGSGTTNPVTTTLALGNVATGTLLATDGTTPVDPSNSGDFVTGYKVVTDIETGKTELQDVGYTSSDAGTYSLPGLADGNYLFEYTDNGSPVDSLAQSTWNAGTTLGASTTSDVTAVAVTGDVTQDVAQANGAAITGTIGADAPVDVFAYAVNADGSPTLDPASFDVTTNADGTYALSVPAAHYKLYFQPEDGSAVDPEWFDAEPTQALATIIDATTATPTTANATLHDGFTLQGTVTSGSTGIAGVDVYATSVDGSGQDPDSVKTDANGHYSFPGLAPNTYNVEFDGSNAGFPDVYYSSTIAGGTSAAKASAVGAVSGTVTANLVFPETSTVTVHLATKTGAAATNVTADAIPVVNGVPDWASAGIVGGTPVKGKTGTYTIAGLTEGATYTLHIYSTTGTGNVYGQYLGGTPSDFGFTLATANSADLQTFTPTKADEIVNGVIATSPSISGTVTSTSGSKLKTVFVDLLRYVGKKWVEYDESATSSKGVYTFPSEPSGSYKLEFFAEDSNYINAWYGGSTLETATPIYLSETSAKTASVKLATGGTLSGVVHNNDSSPASDHYVFAYPLVGSTGDYTSVGAPIFGDVTSSKGAFSIVGLATGHYALSFEAQDPNDGHAVPQDDPFDATDLNSNAVYTVTAGKTTKTPTIVLPDAMSAPTGTAAGTVSGGPSAFASSSVVSFSALGGFATAVAPISSTGAYSISLTPGDYAWTAEIADAGSTPVSYETESGTVTIVKNEAADLHITTGLETPLAFANTPAATVSVIGGGDAVVDSSTLQATAPTNHATTAEVSYQWLRNGHPIYGAQDPTYAVRGVDFGTQISVRVAVQDDFNATNDDPATVVATQDAPAIVAASFEAGAASISPSTDSAFGTTLTAHTSGWQSGVAYTYQWTRDAVAISGQTGRSYKTLSTDAGHQISVTVTGSKPGYVSDTLGGATAVADSVNVLGAAAPKVTKAPTVKTSKGSDDTIYTVSTGTWSVKSLQYTYQWYADGEAIDTANTNSYGVGPTTQAITVTVTASKTGYQDGSTTVLAAKGTNSLDNEPPTVLDGSAPVDPTNTPLHVAEVLTVQAPESWAFPQLQTPTYTYKWERAAAATPTVFKAISGATKSSYTLAKADVGSTVEVVVTVSAPYYSPQVLDPIVAGTVDTAAITSISGTVTVTHTGTLAAGSKLTAATAGYPSGTKFTYQWLSTLAQGPIVGSTKSTYTLPSNAGGQLFGVNVVATYKTATDSQESEPVEVATPTALTTISSPTITGKTVTSDATSPVGATLTADPGVWNVTGSTYTYQWTRNGIDIPGATASTFVPNGDALGDDITVKVTAKKTGLTTGSDESDAVTITAGAAAVNTTKPKISGTPTDGSTLTATPGVWALDGVTFEYQWFTTGGEVIPGATDATYTVDAAQLGIANGGAASITVKVTAVRNGYADSSAAVSNALIVSGGNL